MHDHSMYTITNLNQSLILSDANYNLVSILFSKYYLLLYIILYYLHLYYYYVQN